MGSCEKQEGRLDEPLADPMEAFYVLKLCWTRSVNTVDRESRGGCGGGGREAFWGGEGRRFSRAGLMGSRRQSWDLTLMFDPSPMLE